ncbi:DUF6290 family protein [Asticcacaulis sp. EMRT-3]|uniref:type II toxin-antitoxin system RelB family antitoxin n=1 Tax=Asticcacaulis sp. EMRT-3 TaxID=3040349 RepID=UPI0024AFE96B|nr:DUF6290 family protein [Asticcacaulis sp. EMRT-3]MDI7775149.1 DUF6290 family protein [Asticcacaulis sp. EMRT-3]
MPTSIRLNAQTEERLNQLSALTGRTKAFYLRELVERGLDDMEDYYLASQTLARVKGGLEPTFSLDEVREEINRD